MIQLEESIKKEKRNSRNSKTILEPMTMAFEKTS